jgi:hypothetical protein
VTVPARASECIPLRKARGNNYNLLNLLVILVRQENFFDDFSLDISDQMDNNPHALIDGA